MTNFKPGDIVKVINNDWTSRGFRYRGIGTVISGKSPSPNHVAVHGNGLEWRGLSERWISVHPAGWLNIPASILQLADNPTTVDAQLVIDAVVNHPQGCRDGKEAFLKSIGLEWPKPKIEVESTVTRESFPEWGDGEVLAIYGEYAWVKFTERVTPRVAELDDLRVKN